MFERNANRDEICIMCSADSHYSMDKAANLLAISIYKTPVDFETRMIDETLVESTIDRAKSEGKKYFIVISNMMTTMFGLIDHADTYTNALMALA